MHIVNLTQPLAAGNKVALSGLNNHTLERLHSWTKKFTECDSNCFFELLGSSFLLFQIKSDFPSFP